MMMRRCAYTKSEPYLAATGPPCSRHRCPAVIPDDVPSIVYDEKANVAYDVGHLLGKVHPIHPRSILI